MLAESNKTGLTPAVSFSVQTISGTGANHLAALFLSKFYEWNGQPIVYLSNPTWGTFLSAQMHLQHWSL